MFSCLTGRFGIFGPFLQQISRFFFRPVIDSQTVSGFHYIFGDGASHIAESDDGDLH